MSRLDADEGLGDEESTPGRPGLPVDPHRLVRALRRGKWWLLASAVLGGVLGVLIAKFVVKRDYESVASIQYQGHGQDGPLEVQRAIPALLAVARSAPVRRETRGRIGLPDDVSLEAMEHIVMVTPDDSAGILSFHGFANSPEDAARYANTGAEVFLAHHTASRRGLLEDQIASLSERIEAAEQELNEARRAYDEFRRANNITDLTAEQEQAIDQAADLRAQADLATAEIETLEARIRSLRQQLSRTERTRTVSAGSSEEQRRVGQLRQLLREARAQGLGEEHPRVRALSAQVEAAQRAASQQGGATRSGTNPVFESLQGQLAEAETSIEATRQRQQSLEALATQAQARTTRFSAIEGQAATRLATVNVKQSLVNELTEERSGIEDQLRDLQSGFRTVAEARPPESAIQSKRKLVVAAAVPMLFVGVMLAMLLFRELRGLRLQTATEVAFWGNGPVIGVSTWPHDPRALMDLVAGMDDYAPEATGTMLVVGLTDAERDLAVDIAGQLNHDWSSQTLVDMPVLALPPGGGARASMAPGPAPSVIEGVALDEPISGEILDRPTEADFDAELALMGGPTEIEVRAQPARSAPPGPIADPEERLVCTAWDDVPEGQALRRAARLADRVLVVVPSHVTSALDLARIKRRLGREDTVGFVLVGASEEVARLDDRKGPVDRFWNPAPA